MADTAFRRSRPRWKTSASAACRSASRRCAPSSQICDGYDINSIGVSVPSRPMPGTAGVRRFIQAFLWSSIGILGRRAFCGAGRR